ncbi:hypothetical protein SDJN02_00874, partial [Cucurbita argyrosperma subsp. argyrosperma]
MKVGVGDEAPVLDRKKKRFTKQGLQFIQPNGCNNVVIAQLLIQPNGCNNVVIAQLLSFVVLGGMLLHHGLGMLKMKHVEFVGWLLMVVALIANSPGMIAH